MIDLISFSLGLMIGLILMLSIFMFRTDGYFRVDTSDPYKDKYMLELSIDLDDVPKKKKLIFEVDTKYIKPQ